MRIPGGNGLKNLKSEYDKIVSIFLNLIVVG